MDINDYLIDQSGKDWPAMIAHWKGVLPATFTLWIVNRVGDLFIVPDDETVHHLNVGAGTLTAVADSRDQFARLLDDSEHANRLLLIPVIDQCVAAGQVLGPTQCYGYKLPPMLGGAYEPDNLQPAELAVNYYVLSLLHAQTKDLALNRPAPGTPAS